ncbi:MAG: hypothetical protein KF741_13170 [Ferruginibacter sp.]|nr:hypothetical protein [Bacteroidota bacterium]MBX2920188.1 hypothetical protein [Ferruginibacter sp.]
MYFNHNLRVKVQDWRNRLYKSTYEQFNNSYYFFFKNIAGTNLIASILNEAITNNPIITEQIEVVKKQLAGYNRFRLSKIQFENEAQVAGFLYSLHQHFISSKADAVALVQNYSTSGGGYDEQHESFITEYIQPLTNYLEDVLDASSSVLYLLEKYKLRTENFLKKDLLIKYRGLDKHYEQLLEDDLRLYLFDNGIDNPFSTPKSSSGRADIVGLLDTSDPLVLEIKIYDSSKNYKKQRIIDGFNQIVKYANDYNKSVGYLVNFVLDNAEFNFQSTTTERTWPQRIEINGKIFYIIFINLFDGASASNSKNPESILVEI